MREYLTWFWNVTRYYYNFCQKMEFRELFLPLKIYKNVWKMKIWINFRADIYIYIFYIICLHILHKYKIDDQKLRNLTKELFESI